MKPYPKYRDSGVEWIGEVPAGWEVQRLKYVAELKSGNMLTAELIKESGEYPVYGGNGLRGYTESYTHVGSFVLIGRQGALCGNICYATGEFWASEHAVVAKLAPGYSLFWFGELLRTMSLNQHSQSAAQPGLAVEYIRNLSIPIPPNKEQTAIATYLDHSTVQIEDLIAKKRRLINLLREERAAVINQAVTKGLDPSVKMKDSGVEWMGQVPEHWKVIKLKFLIADLESGVSVNATDVPCSTKGFGVLKTSCVYTYSFDPSENKEIWESEIGRARVQPRKGSIIISRMNTPELVGASGYVDKDYPNLFLPDRLWQTVFRDPVELNVKWLSYVVKSESFKRVLSSIATGTSPSMKNISKEGFLGQFVPNFDYEEQTALVEYLDHKTAQLDQTITKAEKQIQLLREYRTALISEVVTGKIDVREEVTA